jgi:histidinol-phosphate aminotransferase
MDIKSLVRKNIKNLQPYTSARDIYESTDGILLDANENSLGSTFNEIKGLKLNRYPDPKQKDLIKLVGDYYKVSEKNLFFGVGSDEIIDLLIRIFCEPQKDKVLIPEPTYGMYKVTCEINNIETVPVFLNDEFQVDVDAIKKVTNENVKIIFLCSPNNPTGNLLKKEDVIELCKTSNSIIVVDEAYIDFSIDDTFANEVMNFSNLVILRTFSKAWGLAGIRLGYCIANEDIIKILFKVKAPYNINSFSRYILSNAIENSNKKDEFVKILLKERERLKNQLESLSEVLKVYPSDANFLLVKFTDCRKIKSALFEKGIIVRDRSNQPKLENCIRISIGNEEENDKLWEVLKNAAK